jgi:hypothetical protein
LRSTELIKRSEAEIRVKRAEAIDEKLDADELLTHEDELVREWGRDNADYFGGIIATFNWRLGEGLSPVFGYDEFSDDRWLEEWRAVRRVVVDELAPIPHLAADATLGIWRALTWVRAESDEYVLDPCDYR